MIIGRTTNIIDLQNWHTWFPWVPIRLTEGVWNFRGWYGSVRWLWPVERKIDYKATYGEDPTQHNPPYIYVWEYRDIGVRDAEFGIEGLATP